LRWPLVRMRHHVGNVLKDQAYCERIEASPLNSVECEPSIATEAIEAMNRFAQAVGLLASPVPYEQVVATQFRSLWAGER